ncbi:MAG: hypothetical protein KC561_03620 [Myxococcales bacterium]|nr:hypothetical protein [Myxococcales bacterium]
MTNRPLALCVAALLTTLAAAPSWAQTSDQVSSVDIDFNSDLDQATSEDTEHTYTVNLEECLQLAQNDTFEFTWVFDSDPTSDQSYTLKVKRGSGSCNEDSLTSEDGESNCSLFRTAQNLGNATSNSTLVVEFSQGELFNVSDEASCSQLDGQTVTLTIVFTAFDDNSSTDDSSDSIDSDRITFAFETDRPSAPTNLSAVAGESSIQMGWDAETFDVDADFFVYVSSSVLVEGDTPPTGSLIASSQITGDRDSATITDDDLQANQTYYVAMTYRDTDLNESNLSEVVEVTTQSVTDFYEYYREVGGPDQGGFCSSAPASQGALWLLALIGALVLPRSRRKGGAR